MRTVLLRLRQRSYIHKEQQRYQAWRAERIIAHTEDFDGCSLPDFRAARRRMFSRLSLHGFTHYRPARNPNTRLPIPQEVTL